MMHCCNQCGTTFTRKSSLLRHESGRCKRGNVVTNHHMKTNNTVDNDNNRQSEVPVFHNFESSLGQKRQRTTDQTNSDEPIRNPKIQMLLDAIINDGISKNKELDEPVLKKRKVSSTDTLEPSFLKETLIELEKPIPITNPNPDYTFKEVVIEKPMSIADTSDEDDDESDTGTIDIIDFPAPLHNVQFLPQTVEDLRQKFEEVMRKIAIKRKAGVPERTCDRNEAVFLLDELKRKDGISRRMYRQYNDFLAECLPNIGSGIINNEESIAEEAPLSVEDQIKKDITATADYLIQHDKKELQELVAEIEKDDDIIDTVIASEELIKIFIQREFLGRVGVDEKILEHVDRLSSSKNIGKSTLLKIKMLVNDIEENRQRVKEIVKHFNQAGDDGKMREWVVTQFVKENLITQEQYFKLVEEIDEVDIKRLTDIIKEFKIGEGMDFLP